VRAALGGATYNDLTFQFMVNSPGTITGAYLVDKLRVHSTPLVAAGVNTPTPSGYGGSVDLVVTGGAPRSETIGVGPVQGPASFALKLGTAGNTTVALALGFGGAPAFTCTYGPDTGDRSGKTYRWWSCTGGVQPGDLVPADSAQLNIIGGDSTQKIR